MRKALVLIAAAVCWLEAATAEAADAGPYPANYKDMVATVLKRMLNDPYSMRDVSIAKPTLDGPLAGFSDQDPAWLICFEANTKNETGGYIGISQAAFAIRDNQVIWYMWAGYSIQEVNRQLAAGLEQTWADLEGQGYQFQDVLAEYSSMYISVFVHAYCRHAEWERWVEMEGR